ncbi:MAG TPA: thiamine-phosphate kinase, partial [Terriglobales bacterium]|nr:thiamine-phosphate kinase [Terriglobales bacterium]
SSRNRAVVHGIGDDCAVLRAGAGLDFLITTDLCIENVHFVRKWHPARCVGHRCLARGLSDIAAMGGEPLACFLSFGLPAKLPQKWADEFLRGLEALARKFGVQLAGGDIAAAPVITADIVVTGRVPAGRALLRSGARASDRIFVSGELGGSAATLKRLFAGERIAPSHSSRHFYPEPRMELGRWLREGGLATAVIDLSDGLSVDLAHICQESGVDAVIDAAKIPVARGATLECALHGGEDYELLFTVPPKKNLPPRINGVKVTEIGVIRKAGYYASAIQILGENRRLQALEPRGWQHFGKSR